MSDVLTKKLLVRSEVEMLGRRARDIGSNSVHTIAIQTFVSIVALTSCLPPLNMECDPVHQVQLQVTQVL